MMTFRDNGAIGALLDEYERAMDDLQNTIADVNQHELHLLVDLDTKDEDCRSIQTILTHVVRAGIGYVLEIRKSLGEKHSLPAREKLDTIEAYQLALKKMFETNVQLFADYPTIKLEEYEVGKKIKVGWGQYYDVEQLMEHAIVHILRHRRQIERFLQKIHSSTSTAKAPQ